MPNQRQNLKSIDLKSPVLQPAGPPASGPLKKFGLDLGWVKKVFSHSDVKRYAFLVLIALVLVLAGSTYYFHSKYSALTGGGKLSDKDVKGLVATVGRLIVLPDNETPTVATVSDPDKLRSQPFFTNSKKGDKVLIYSGARKAILYRPEERKIIEVAPLNLTTPAPTPTGSPQAMPTPSARPRR